MKCLRTDSEIPDFDVMKPMSIVDIKIVSKPSNSTALEVPASNNNSSINHKTQKSKSTSNFKFLVQFQKRNKPNSLSKWTDWVSNLGLYDYSTRTRLLKNLQKHLLNVSNQDKSMKEFSEFKLDKLAEYCKQNNYYLGLSDPKNEDSRSPFKELTCCINSMNFCSSKTTNSQKSVDKVFDLSAANSLLINKRSPQYTKLDYSVGGQDSIFSHEGDRAALRRLLENAESEKMIKVMQNLAMSRGTLNLDEGNSVIGSRSLKTGQLISLFGDIKELVKNVKDDIINDRKFSKTKAVHYIESIVEGSKKLHNKYILDMACNKATKRLKVE